MENDDYDDEYDSDDDQLIQHQKFDLEGMVLPGIYNVIVFNLGRITIMIHRNRNHDDDHRNHGHNYHFRNHDHYH